MWDFPRPPALRRLDAEVRVKHAGVLVARTSEALEVLETSHPPTVYLPPDAFAEGVLRPGSGRSFCEFKGTADYLDLVVRGVTVVQGAAWTYPAPTPAFAALAMYVSLHPGRVDSCTVAGERVQPQGGPFYGGWVFGSVVGPWKGGPGTRGW